jgi:hypothetical protein
MEPLRMPNKVGIFKNFGTTTVVITLSNVKVQLLRENCLSYGSIVVYFDI